MGKDLIADSRLKPLIRYGVRNVRVSSSRFRLDARRTARFPLELELDLDLDLDLEIRKFRLAETPL